MEPASVRRSPRQLISKGTAILAIDMLSLEAVEAFSTSYPRGNGDPVAYSVVGNFVSNCLYLTSYLMSENLW